MNAETKVVIRLIGGPANGFVFTVPVQKIPPLVGVGPVARYERETADGEVICYRLAKLKTDPSRGEPASSG